MVHYFGAAGADQTSGRGSEIPVPFAFLYRRVVKTHPIGPSQEGFIPHLCCSPCTQAIEFYKQAFGAVEVFRMPAPDGNRIMHAALLIDGKPLFLVDDFPEYCGGKSETATSLGGSPVTIHRFVTDCDAAIQRALDAVTLAVEHDGERRVSTRCFWIVRSDSAVGVGLCQASRCDAEDAAAGVVAGVAAETGD